MGFREWLQIHEVGTSTADCAGFARMTMPMIRRELPSPWGEEDQDEFFKRRKKKPKNGV